MLNYLLQFFCFPAVVGNNPALVGKNYRQLYVLVAFATALTMRGRSVGRSGDSDSTAPHLGVQTQKNQIKVVILELLNLAATT